MRTTSPYWRPAAPSEKVTPSSTTYSLSEHAGHDGHDVNKTISPASSWSSWSGILKTKTNKSIAPESSLCSNTSTYSRREIKFPLTNDVSSLQAWMETKYNEKAGSHPSCNIDCHSRSYHRISREYEPPRRWPSTIADYRRHSTTSTVRLYVPTYYNRSHI